MHGPLRNCAAVTKIACTDRYHLAPPLRNCSTLKNEKSKTAVTKIALTGLSEITPFVVQKSRVALSGYVRGEIEKLKIEKLKLRIMAVTKINELQPQRDSDFFLL